MGIFKYKSLIDFKKENKYEYIFLFKNNLLEKFCKDLGWENTLKKVSKWNRKTCLERALKYTTKRDWKKYDQGSYEASRTKEWYGECINHMVELIKPSGYWNKTNCLKDASMWSTLKEWSKKNPTAVANSRKNGWFDECIAHMEPIRKINMPTVRKKSGYWTKKNFLLECKKYDSYYDLKINNPSACECARGKGYLDEVILSLGWNKRKPLGRKIKKWSKEKCLESALKYTRKIDWEKKDTNAYSASRRNGWYEECTAHMGNLIKPSGYWENKERCVEEAKRYKTKEEFKKQSTSANHSARRNGWYEECTAHMIKVQERANYWTKEKCLEDALKYTKLKDWRIGNQTAHNKSRKNGWFDECIAHMEPIRKKERNINSKENCLVEALKYSSRKEWKINNSSTVYSAIKNGWYEECIKHMGEPKYGKTIKI